MKELLRGFKGDTRSRMGTTGGGSEDAQGMNPNKLAELNPYIGEGVMSFAQGGSYYPPHNILTNSGSGFGEDSAAIVPNLQVYAPPPVPINLINATNPTGPTGPKVIDNRGREDKTKPAQREVYDPVLHGGGTGGGGELEDEGGEGETSGPNLNTVIQARINQQNLKELLRGYRSGRKGRMGTTGGGREELDLLAASLLAELNPYIGSGASSFNHGGQFMQQANEALAMNQLSSLVANSMDKRNMMMAQGGAFNPHMMYDPKTGEGYMANKLQDHLDMKEKGYDHRKRNPENYPKAAYGMKKRYTNGGRF